MEWHKKKERNPRKRMQLMLKTLLEKQCSDDASTKIMRLGKSRDGNLPYHPLLVITSTITEAKIVLESAGKLKDYQGRP